MKADVLSTLLQEARQTTLIADQTALIVRLPAHLLLAVSEVEEAVLAEAVAADSVAAVVAVVDSVAAVAVVVDADKSPSQS